MRRVLLTGLPGVGKSTACRKVAELCQEQDLRVEGFLTEELRERGSRVGFDVVELGGRGRRVPLARVGGGDGPRVSKYSVMVAEFEALALPILDSILNVPPQDREHVVCIIDEIGKMELFSNDFVLRMRELLQSPPVPVLCTVALYGGGFVAEAKRIRGPELVEITEATRGKAPADIVGRLLGSRGRPQADVSFSAVEGSPSQAAPAPRGGVRGKLTRRRWQAKDSASAEDEELLAQRAHAPAGESLMGGKVLLWLRNELRLADNGLLTRAVELSRQRNASLLPVFCFDPHDFGSSALTALGSPKVGEVRRHFIEEAVRDLSAGLSQRGSQLIVCDAAPEEVLPVLAGRGDTVLAGRESCPEEQAAEGRVRRALSDAGAALELVDCGGTTTIFGTEELQKAGLCEGSAFPEDFRVFYDAVKGAVPEICRIGLCAAPEQLPPAGPLPRLPPGFRDSIAAGGSSGSRSSAGPAEVQPAAGPAIKGGETEGLARMRSWLQSGGLKSYKATFRRLLGDYSSRLSAHLALGCISPRRLCAEALDSVRQGPHVEHFVYEMCWRDFFRHAARRWGSSLFQQDGPLGPGGIAREWRRDSEAEDRWRHGTTGVPLVDATMRELNLTGYMGNLARQIAAAFLVEELRVDWRVGADWFEARLIDYDPHSNWGQWARSAGVAPTNEAKKRRVGGTRYLDIALGIENGEAASYVRAWVPEVIGVPEGELFAPWCRGEPLPSYPHDPLCSGELRRYFEGVGSMGVKVGRKGGGQKGGGRGGKGRSSRWGS